MSELGYFIDKYSNSKDGKIKTTDGFIEKAKFILFAQRFSLALMPGWNKNDNKPLCFSHDGVRPHGGTHMQIGTCEDCQLNSWKYDHESFQGRAKVAWNLTGQHANKKPCSDRYTLLGFSMDNHLPFTIVIHGSAIKHLRKIQTQLLGRAMQNKEKLSVNAKKRKEMLRTPILLTMVREGTSYAPRLDLLEDEVLSDNDYGCMVDYYNLVCPPRDHRSISESTREEPGLIQEETKLNQESTREEPGSSQESAKENTKNKPEALPGDAKQLPSNSQEKTKKKTKSNQVKTKEKPKKKAKSTKRGLAKMEEEMFGEKLIYSSTGVHNDPA